MKPSLFERLRPITPEYARLSILEGFNWPECLAHLDAAKFYLVVFRSVRRESADPIRLLTFDDRAYAEAREATGLLYYFRGSLNERRECLSFCVWESQELARAATGLPAHEAAAELTDEMYVSFDLERWLLVKQPRTGRLELLPAQDDTVLPSGRTPAQPKRANPAWHGSLLDAPSSGSPTVSGAEAAG